MRRRTVLKSSLLALGALSAIGLKGCSQQSPTATNTASGEAATAGKPLRIGLVPWIGWSRAQVAEVKGFFKEAGVEVEQKVFQTVTEVNTALLAKQVDLAWLVAGDLVVLSEQDPTLKFLFASDYSGDKVDAIVGSGIASPADVKGKKLAREDVPYEIVFTAKYLESIGLTTKDVEIISLPVPDATAAMATGKVDIVTSYEPFISKALKERADSKILFSAKGTNIIVNGLAGSSKVLTERRSEVMAYLKALEKAVQFAKTNADEANAITAKWVGVTPPEVAELMARLDLLDVAANKTLAFAADNPLNAASSIDLAGPILVEAGKAKKVIKGKDFVDDSFALAL